MVATNNYFIKEKLKEIIRKRLYETRIMFHYRKSSRNSDDLVELPKESKEDFEIYYLEYRTSRRQVIYGDIDVREIENHKELDLK